MARRTRTKKKKETLGTFEAFMPFFFSFWQHQAAEEKHVALQVYVEKLCVWGCAHI